MRGRTNAIDVGVSVIGEVQLCEVAESSRIEKGEFVETFYRGKTGYLPTLFAGYTGNYYYDTVTNNYVTKVPGDNNYFIIRTKNTLVSAMVIKLFDYKANEFIELYSYNYGYIPSVYGESYLFFLDEEHFVVYGYSSSEQKDYVALFRLSNDKKSFTLIQNFKPDFGDDETYGRGRAFPISDGIIIFNPYIENSLYKFTFDGNSIHTSPSVIPITYSYGSDSTWSKAYPFSAGADIAKLQDRVYAYTNYTYVKQSSSSSYYYHYYQVNVVTISEDFSTVNVKPIYGYRASNDSNSSPYIAGPFNVARLNDNFFIVNGGGHVSSSSRDIVRIFHITEGLVLTQDINASSSNSSPITNFQEVKENVVFGFLGVGVLKLIFDPTTRTLVWGWNNNGKINSLKRGLCLFSDETLFIAGLKSGTLGNNDTDYSFYTLKDGSLYYGFDGADGLVNLVRSYSGGKITGVANQSGNEGDVIEINVPLAIT